MDQRTDLFSLGVVLYDMATGRLPFNGDSPTETMDKILMPNRRPWRGFNQDIPAELERIIRKCLEKDRELRYQHASDVCTDLKRLKRDTDSGKAAVSRAEVRGKVRVRWLALGIGTGLALIALVAWSGVLAFHPRNRDSGSPAGACSPDELSWVWNLTPVFRLTGRRWPFNGVGRLGSPGQNCHIYVKQVGVEPPSQLTTCCGR